MNIIDGMVLGLILLYVLNGVYRGFLPSVANMCGFFLSWISALIFFRPISSSLASSPLFSSLRFYIEGAENVGDYEIAKRALSSFSPNELKEVIAKTSASLAPPYKTAVIKNVAARTFESEGLTTVGEYFDASIYTVMLNILAFLIVFVCVRIVVTLLINSYTYAEALPELRHFDRTIGGAVSLARGFLSMYVVFSVVPLAIMLVPVQFVIDIINSSTLTGMFYNGSILLSFLA